MTIKLKQLVLINMNYLILTNLNFYISKKLLKYSFIVGDVIYLDIS
jgi:hypothetical protein